MSDPSNPAAPTAKARPSSVTVASYLLFAVAALQLVNVILSLSYVSKVKDAYRDLYAGTTAEGTESFATIAGIGGAVVYLLIAVGLVVLGVLNNRGKNAARITTWVVGGIAVCCLGFGLAGTALSNSMNTGGGDVPSGAEVQAKLDEVLPSWYGPLTTTLSVISLLALLTALILLALPASNAFFRKPAPGYGHPVPGGAYPGYPQGGAGEPGYPSAPGQPSAPGYPSAPEPPPAHPHEPGPRTDRGDQPPSTPPAG